MACIVCGSNAQRIWASNKFFPKSWIIDCCKCASVYPWPRPKQEEVDTFYGEIYYRYGPLARWVKKRLGDLFARSRKAWIDQYVFLTHSSKILEIGCGYGNLLAQFSPVMSRRGIEPAAECIEHCISRRFEIQQSTFEKAEFDPPYRLIIMAHVLEHLVAPEEAIEKLKTLLAPGGYLYLEVPNRNAPTYKKNHYRNTPDFYFFDRDGFEMFLKNHGLVGDVFNMEVAGIWKRYDKWGCGLQWPLFEILNVFKDPLLYRGGDDSFAICAVVKRL